MCFILENIQSIDDYCAARYYSKMSKTAGTELIAKRNPLRNQKLQQDDTSVYPSSLIMRSLP